MIRFAAGRDHPRLKALWAEVFGDPPAAIDAYFHLRHADENMLVDVRDDTVAGMLSLLPVTLASGGGHMFPARYIYAVATDMRYRGQGVSTALLNAAHTHMKDLGEAAAVLVPANPGLFDFYGKRDYRTAFSLDVIAIRAADLPSFPRSGRLEPCSAADYTSLRNRAFQGSRLFARWEERAVGYALHTLEQAGGAAIISWDGGNGCAAWEQTDAGVLVRELALVGGDVHTALSVLHQHLHAETYTVRLAEGTVPAVAPKPFGMIRWLIPEPALTGAPPYLSLAMD